jgi:glyoxylase-like metal-dependent hydrolase (beta-lactamase superfamily II)/rhodanese-related sulfurtransferase
VIFTQFVDDDLGCASYLVGDEDEGAAVAVDPPYAIEPLLVEAERRGVRLVGVLETHTHADHVSGHGRLALEHDLPVYIHPLADAEYPSVSFEDGQTVDLGSVRIRCLHTPGHRPEHSCFAVADRGRAEEPWLVLTGDSLVVGDAARPDLAVGAMEGAEGLFHSLRRLLELPDGVEVFPGHVAGSLCGKAMSSKASTTIGFERRFNPMLSLAELDAFVAASSAIASPKPPNLRRIVELNRGPFVGSPEPVERLDTPVEGTQLLDVRPVRAFLDGHAPTAVNVPVGGSSFATKAGFVLDAERPVTLYAADEDEAERAARGLRSVAFLDVAGFLLGGGDERGETVTVEDLDDLVASGGAEIVDVREQDERDTGYIPGSRNIPYRLLAICGADLPLDRPVVTVCESGARAAIAASVLTARGYDARPVVDGGIAAWRARGGETVSFRRCGS